MSKVIDTELLLTLKERALVNPATLSTILGYKNNEHHINWYRYLRDTDNKRLVIDAPRESAKSSVFSFIYPLWELTRNPNIRIVIVSNAQSQSMQFLRQIVNVIENNEDYQRYFGNKKPQLPERWTDEAIIVERTTLEKDPTISVVGTGGSVLSRRCDVLICDDILNMENTRTPEQRKKTRDWFMQVLRPILVKGGRLIWIGTPFNKQDLGRELMANPSYDIKKMYKSIIKESQRQDLWQKYETIYRGDIINGKKLANEFFAAHTEEMLNDTEVLWQDNYSYKDLIDIKLEVGTKAFNLSYQCEIRDDENSIFKEEWIDNSRDDNLSLFTKYDPAVDIHGIEAVASGVDLAIGDNDESAYTVMTTIARTKQGKLLLLNREKGHYSPQEMREMIVNQAERFKPSIVLIEDNAFQKSFVLDMQGMGISTTVPIKGFTTTGEKYDEQIGINALAVTFETGKWIMPSNQLDAKTRTAFDEYKSEMLDFPTGHTGDSLMSLWFAWTGLRNTSGTSGIEMIRNKGSSWGSTRLTY